MSLGYANSAAACTPPAELKKPQRVELITNRLDYVLGGIEKAIGRAREVADLQFGPEPPPAPPAGAIAMPAPSPGALAVLERQLDEGERLLSRLHNQLDRLETL